MSEQVVIQVNELLNQEKWTRTSLTNYTNQSFKDLDATLEQVFEAKIQDEILALCDDHLASAKNSVIALYLSGIINLSRQSINDGNLISLIRIFTENGRWKIAEALAMRMLDFGENRMALRTLADCYENDNRIDLKFEIWERLIRVDFDEADIVLKIAERYEASGNMESATTHFKKALHRFINRRQFTQVRDTWRKLLVLCPDDVDFFFHAEGKIAKHLGDERAVMILEDLYPVFKANSRYDLTLDVLKRVAAYDQKNAFVRKEIIDCYREIHKGHSQLEDYLQLSNLSQTWRNIFDAIADFEKHIAFDAGNFVFHRTWGLGKIVSVMDDFITIDFIKQKNHKMSLKLAVSALTILAKDHFWVQLVNTPKVELQKKVKEDIVWTLKTIIKSFGNAADMKRIKAELSPRVLSDSEWTTWSTKARNILKTEESFGNLPDKPDVYVVREQPISLEEKTYNRFKAEKDFFNRVKILQEFLNYSTDNDDQSAFDSEHFREMLGYFVGFIKNPSQVNENVLASFVLVHSVVARFSFLNPGQTVQFKELFEAIDDLRKIFDDLSNNELRRDFLYLVRKNIKNWHEVYLTLLPQFLQKEIVHELLRHGNVKEVEALYLQSLGTYKEKREVFSWFTRSFYTEEWFINLNIPQEKLLVSLIHLMDVSARELEGRKDIVENRRLNKQIQTFIFKEGYLESWLSSADQEKLERIYSLLEDVKDVEPKQLQDIRIKIGKIYPDFNFFTGKDKEREIETVNRSGFFTIGKSYEEKSKALQVLLEVEVPKNSKEIGVARDYGDLRENAEYKAAKERQELLNTTAARWKEELEQAKIFSAEDIDTSKISFGTIVTLHNDIAKKTETYTIMGPWESNPDESVISYLSPFGLEIFKHGVGDKLKFIINERAYGYTVKSIKKADFTKIRTTTPITL